MNPQRHRFPPFLVGLLVIFVAVAFLLNLASARWAKGRAGEDRQAIQHVLDTQVAAWNRHDLEGFMAGYWPSPDLTFFSGKEVYCGWQAAFERYRKRYQSDGSDKMGKLSFADLKIDLLGPDSALVRGRWKLVRGNEPLGGLFTLLFKKKPEGWRIIHDHTSG
jgi:uncharacterized protein (TIGR02246 family)